MGELIGPHPDNIPIYKHNHFSFDGKKLIPISGNEVTEPAQQPTKPERTALPDANERGVIRVPKRNGPRRLTIVGTPDQFEPTKDPQQ